ncbi:MAG: hypothetical protein JNJ63_01435 [Hyphomonadaceae bacterium]|nr:hypothetical protein [Hyphomonadaceae bacterium]
MALDTLATWVSSPAALWLGGAGAVVLFVLFALFYTPARTTILVDTPTSTARADMRLLWGLGPSLTRRLFPRASAGAPVAHFNDVARIGHALITPGIADATIAAITQLAALKPRVAEVALVINVEDGAKSRVIETAVQAALTMAPPALRQVCSVTQGGAAGAELSAKFELDASPARLGSIWNRYRRSRAAREFVKRLRRKPKPVKKPVREVRTA